MFTNLDIPEKSKKDKSSGEFGHEDGLENGNLGDDTSNVSNFAFFLRNNIFLPLNCDILINMINFGILRY